MHIVRMLQLAVFAWALSSATLAFAMARNPDDAVRGDSSRNPSPAGSNETEAPADDFGSQATDTGVPGDQNTIGSTPLPAYDRGTIGVDNTGRGTTGIGGGSASPFPPGSTGSGGGTGQ